MSIVTGFAEKMDKLISYDQILLEDSRYIGITEDGIDGYIAYKIQRFMNKYVINPKSFIHYNATENEIRERMKAFVPDITDEHIMRILEKMVLHGFIHKKSLLYHLDKKPKRNVVLGRT